MADKQHLKWLAEGVAAWNKRRGNSYFKADLQEANLQGADLQEANVRSVKYQSGPNDESDWYFTDLTSCVNLSQDQLNSMNGDTGTRIPDHLTYPVHWPVLEEDPQGDISLLKPFVFLSYSQKDAELVGNLHRFLSAQDIPIWWDQDISGGVWRDQIAYRLEKAAAVLTIWTGNSVGSNAVREEADTAQKTDRLVHVRFDEAQLPFGFSETQYFDLRGWDGAAHHSEMRKVLQALRDKLDPPTSKALQARLAEASSVEALAINGKISLVDRPVNTPPPVIHPEDKQKRINAQIRLAGLILSDVREKKFNVSEELAEFAEEYQGCLSEDDLNWYILDDAMEDFRNCMHDDPYMESWPNRLRNRCLDLTKRHRKLEPLIRPKQIPFDDPNAPLPMPEPNLNKVIYTLSSDIETSVAETKQTNALAAVLDKLSVNAVVDRMKKLPKSIADYQNAYSDQDKEKKSGWLRRNIKIVAGTLSTLIGGIIISVATSVLTAPGAAQTLAQNFQKLLDILLQLF